MNLLQQIENDKILNKIKQEFDNEIYLVGGAVRDFAMGKKTYDRDLIVTDRDAREFSLALAEKFMAVFVPLDEKNKIYRLVFRDKLNYLDITNPINNSLDDDLKRRDLTINSVAVNLKTLEILDPFGGLDNIKNKKINMICEQNFSDDPLRMLRAFRFHAVTGFEISKSILDFVGKNVKLIHKPALERINYEILKMFGGNYVHETLLLADDCGLLTEIFPVMLDVKKVPPNSHHHLDLFHHSIETVKQINEIYNNSSENVKKHLNRIDFGGLPRISHLKLAGFLHDIGKFSTWTIEDGRHRFIKHDDVGSKMAHDILKGMHFSNKQVEYVSYLIKNHIYPSQVMSAPDVTDKVMMRFVRKSDLNAIDNIILAMADRLSARGVEITDEMVERNITALNRLLEFYLAKRESLKPLPKLLDGNKVMRILKLKPSPKLGEIMDALLDAQIAGDVTTRDEAVKFVQNL